MYTNSSLALAYYPSPHCSDRIGEITKITVHHAAAVASAKQIANHFQAKGTRASTNYVIGKDGGIVMCVPEKCRAWASNAPGNDNAAVNIEVANATGNPDWLVSDAAWKSLVKLCVDICRRNQIESLRWTGDSSGNLTIHKFFAATVCPGPYLEAKMPELAKTVNGILAAGDRYQQLEDVPQWGRDTIRRLVEAGHLMGTGEGLDLSADMVRTLVIVDRMISGGDHRDA